MTDRPSDFDPTELDEDDIDMGEPVTDKLNVLLEAVEEGWADEEAETDLAEPVTDKLVALLDQLPDDWDSEDAELDLAGSVTTKLSVLLTAPVKEGFWSRVRRLTERRCLSSDVSPRSPRGILFFCAEFARAVFGGSKQRKKRP